MLAEISLERVCQGADLILGLRERHKLGVGVTWHIYRQADGNWIAWRYWRFDCNQWTDFRKKVVIAPTLLSLVRMLRER